MERKLVMYYDILKKPWNVKHKARIWAVVDPASIMCNQIRLSSTYEMLKLHVELNRLLQSMKYSDIEDYPAFHRACDDIGNFCENTGSLYSIIECFREDCISILEKRTLYDTVI